MKRSLILSLACAVLVSSIGSIQALTPVARGNIQKLTKDIEDGTVTGSAIWQGIQQLKIPAKETKDFIVKKLDKVATDALNNQGYTINGALIASIVQAVQNGMVPTKTVPTVTTQTVIVTSPQQKQQVIPQIANAVSDAGNMGIQITPQDNQQQKDAKIQKIIDESATKIQSTQQEAQKLLAQLENLMATSNTNEPVTVTRTTPLMGTQIIPSTALQPQTLNVIIKDGTRRDTLDLQLKGQEEAEEIKALFKEKYKTINPKNARKLEQDKTQLENHVKAIMSAINNNENTVTLAISGNVVTGTPVTINILTKTELERFDQLLTSIVTKDLNALARGQFIDATDSYPYQPAFTAKSESFRMSALRDECFKFVEKYKDITDNNDKVTLSSALKKYVLIQCFGLNALFANLRELSVNRLDSDTSLMGLISSGQNNKNESLSHVLHFSGGAQSLLDRLYIDLDSIFGVLKALDGKTYTTGKIIAEFQNTADVLVPALNDNLTAVFSLFLHLQHVDPSKSIASLARAGDIAKITKLLDDDMDNLPIKNLVATCRRIFNNPITGVENVINGVLAYSIHGANTYCINILDTVKKIKAEQERKGWLDAAKRMLGFTTTLTTKSNEVAKVYSELKDKLNQFVASYCNNATKLEWSKGTFNVVIALDSATAMKYEDSNNVYFGYGKNSTFINDIPLSRAIDAITSLQQ